MRCADSLVPLPATDPATSAAIALGLLIWELSQEPWKGRVITFDETHKLHKLHGANLKVKLQPLVAALGPRKKGANRQGVFSKILGTAVAGGLRVGAAQEHAFHALAPSLPRSSSHTRRRPEVEDEQ